MDPVSVVACPDYDPDRVTDAMREAVSAVLGSRDILGGGRRVLIKPNLLSDTRPERAVTTHPSVVRAAIRLVKEAGGIPLVGDSPALQGRTEARYHHTCEITGILGAVEMEGAELVRFDGATVELQYPEGKIQKHFLLGEAVTKANVVFNLPKLKTHGLAVMTGGVKNLFGCVPGLRKASYHLSFGERSEYFAESLLDLALMIHPALTVIDAVVAMEGPGPSNGKPRQVGYLIASRTPWAADLMAARIIGIDPRGVGVLRAAESRGLIEQPWPDPPVPPIVDFKLPTASHNFPPWLENLLKNQFVRQPWMDPARCNLCGDCKRICPPQAISQVESRGMVVDYRACIRCYCCHEVCKQDAIDLRRSWLRRHLSRRR